ncbi:hypothetical protein V8F20_005741 [Naviculisporaceae sp. PSN 640]
MSDSLDLLDAFKAAALSVTKLYKMSAAAQTRSRAEGYQDCLDDLLAFLDKENIGLSDGEGLTIRKWATDRQEPRDTISQTMESEDEVEKPETSASSPQLQRSSSVAPQPAVRNDTHMRDSAPPTVPSNTTPSISPIVEDVEIVVPSQETFNFQSSIPYPSYSSLPSHDTYISLANLDLSDSQTHSSNQTTRQGGSPTTTATTPTISRNARLRNGRPASRTALNRVAGQKRKVNLDEIFDLGSLGHGNGKDVFGGGKRSRHA